MAKPTGYLEFDLANPLISDLHIGTTVSDYGDLDFTVWNVAGGETKGVINGAQWVVDVGLDMLASGGANVLTLAGTLGREFRVPGGAIFGVYTLNNVAALTTSSRIYMGTNRVAPLERIVGERSGEGLVFAQSVPYAQADSVEVPFFLRITDGTVSPSTFTAYVGRDTDGTPLGVLNSSGAVLNSELDLVNTYYLGNDIGGAKSLDCIVQLFGVTLGGYKTELQALDFINDPWQTVIRDEGAAKSNALLFGQDF